MIRARSIAGAVATVVLAVPGTAAAHQAILGTVYGPGCGPARQGQGPPPARGIEVVARLERSHWAAAEDTSDRKGRVRLDLPPGRYVVAARSTNGTPQRQYHVRLRRHHFPHIDIGWNPGGPPCL